MYTVQVTVNDGARVWVDGVLLIDQYDNEVGDGQAAAVFSAPTPTPLVANRLVSVKIEYRENAGPAAFTLGWVSTSQPYEVVPSYRLFPSAQEIAGSPFTVSPSGRKPTPVGGVTLSPASWNSLTVNFTAPADDGGSEVVGYQVQWFDATPLAAFVPEVQTIKMSRLVTGGTFTIISPGGHTYPYPIPYDTDGPTMAAILMRLPDVGRVAVSYTDAADGGANRAWTITYLCQSTAISTPGLRLAGRVMVGGSGLVTTSPTGAAVGVCSGEMVTQATPTVPLCAPTDSTIAVNFPATTLSPPGAVTLTVGSLGHYTYTIPLLNQTSAVQAGFGVRVVAVNRDGWSSVPSPEVFAKPVAVADGPLYAEILRVAGRDDALRVYWSQVRY